MNELEEKLGTLQTMSLKTAFMVVFGGELDRMLAAFIIAMEPALRPGGHVSPSGRPPH
jgi:hypothetical protein